MGLFAKLREGLTKTRDSLMGRVDTLVKETRKIDEDFYEELEDILLMSDCGMKATTAIMDELRRRVSENKVKDADTAKQMLKDIMIEQMDIPRPPLRWPMVMLVVGVNGAGKTTTIGKLALRFQNIGRRIILCAADTFRAAAADQLTVWAERARVPIVKHAEGADPAAVVYDGIQSAKAQGADLLIVDTAGRLHNKKNLMEELRKLAGLSETAFRTMQRKAADSPHISSAFIGAVGEINAEETTVNVPVTPVVENVIRFRDRFPFLNSPDCPDVLKILVADMFTAYDLYLKTFRELGELPDDAELEQAFGIAKTTVENYLEDRSIWEELEYYRDNHVLLGKHPRVAASLASDELSNKSDLEVMNIRKNAASNVSKWKKKLETVEGEEERAKALAAVDKWESMKSAAEKELENRKKN